MKTKKVWLVSRMIGKPINDAFTMHGMEKLKFIDKGPSQHFVDGYRPFAEIKLAAREMKFFIFL